MCVCVCVCVCVSPIRDEECHSLRQVVCALLPWPVEPGINARASFGAMRVAQKDPLFSWLVEPREMPVLASM